MGQVRESDGDEDSSRVTEESDTRGPSSPHLRTASSKQTSPANQAVPISLRGLAVCELSPRALAVREVQSAIAKEHADSARADYERESGPGSSALEIATDFEPESPVGQHGDEVQMNFLQERKMSDGGPVENEEDRAERQEKDDEELSLIHI